MSRRDSLSLPSGVSLTFLARMRGLLDGPCGGRSVDIVNRASRVRRVRLYHLALTLRQMLVGPILGLSLFVVVKERVEIRRRWV